MTNTLEAYYIIKDEIGHGSYGYIYSGERRQDHAPVAVKFVSIKELGPEDQNDAFREVLVTSQVANDYIVHFYDAFMQSNYLIICMEFIPGGTLGDVISQAKSGEIAKPIEESVIWRYLAETLLGLQYLHNRRIVHRDLKPQNIMICKDGHLKITDFGFGKLLGNQTMAKSIVGTPLYQSPELVSGKGGNEKVDTWAVGCIGYELTTLEHPFKARTQVELSNKIMNESPKPIPSHYSKELSDFIFSMLTRDMDKRPSVTDLLQFPRIHEEVIKLGAADPLREEKSRIWREMAEFLGDDKSIASQLSWLVDKYAKLRIDHEAVSEAKEVESEDKTDDAFCPSSHYSSEMNASLRDIEDEREKIRKIKAELAKREATLRDMEEQLKSKK